MCTAIGNQSRIIQANFSASSTKKRVGAVARIELLYTCCARSGMYARNAPPYTPGLDDRVTSTSSAPTRRDITKVPSRST